MQKLLRIKLQKKDMNLYRCLTNKYIEGSGVISFKTACKVGVKIIKKTRNESFLVF